MARFIDLDEDEDARAEVLAGRVHVGKPLPLPENRAAVMIVGSEDRNGVLTAVNGWHGMDAKSKHVNGSDKPPSTEVEKNNGPTFRNVVTEAFQCYPIVFAIVSCIDVNTLDALSRTSRLVHDSLIQYRSSLLLATLRCTNERMPVDPYQALRYRARASNWYYMDDGRSYHGKAGSCARDMVGECRRCAEVVCRNCAIKPPAPVTLRERHRRLCIACASAPLPTLASPPLDVSLPLNSDYIQRVICKCDTEGVWLCQPCGRTIRNADNEYKRIWRWRNQYGEVLGGLGTGIGDGDRGVVCGREEACLAAREREHEIDCDAEDARGNTAAPWSNGSSSNGSTPGSQHNGTPPNNNGGFPFINANDTIESLIEGIRHERTPSPQLGPGYERHEIEGIGGIVKRKLVRMVRVGACVPEWEDERGGLGSSGKVLAREVNGSARSWCGWCWRVIPGEKDRLGDHPAL